MWRTDVPFPYKLIIRTDKTFRVWNGSVTHTTLKWEIQAHLQEAEHPTNLLMEEYSLIGWRMKLEYNYMFVYYVPATITVKRPGF